VTLRFLAFLFFPSFLFAQPAADALTLPDAMRLAIEKNLSTRLAQAASEEARGQAIQAAAALLPTVVGTASQARVFKVNLEASGFPTGGPFPSLVGPFNSFDARLQLVQNVLDLSAYWRFKAGRAGLKTASLREKLAREQVAASAALFYVEAQRTARAVGAAQANVKLAESLFKLARDQKEAGVSTGVDVARAETSLAQTRLQLIRAHMAADAAQIRLKRLAGLPMDKPLTLQDFPRHLQPSTISADQAIDTAVRERLELQIAQESMKTSAFAAKASRAAALPSVRATGDYGFSGTTPSNSARTGKIGGAVEVPILSGGAVRAGNVLAAANQSEMKSRLSDMQAQVEEDVRLALQTLMAAFEETRAADQAVSLAQKELRMAQNRFSAGVGDNIQVLSAEAALDRAQDDQVNATARYDTARVNFALATGQMEAFRP
jgi:outer membrane protein TolC